jgi:hypothetical protein
MIDSVDALVAILKDPTGCVIHKKKGKTVVATREIYKTASGGWAVTYRGGDLPDHIFREALRRGLIQDAYAGKFEGAHHGVGYDLTERVRHDGSRQRSTRRS